MTELITTPLTEMTSKINELEAFFIILLIVVLVAIGVFGFVVIKMIIATRDRAELRNEQITKAVQSSMCAINAVEELKVILETHINHCYGETKELKQVDIRIFDKIEEVRDMVIKYLVDRGKNDKS